MKAFNERAKWCAVSALQRRLARHGPGLGLCLAGLVLSAACGSDNGSDGTNAGSTGGSGNVISTNVGGGASSASGGRRSGTGGAGATGSGGTVAGSNDPFSFFVTSCEALQALSGSADGFGGDLRFGEATGLAGADKICQTIATNEGFGNKTWRAFLSVTAGPVNAIDRVGSGPWYDRLGRVVATGVAGLARERPDGDTAVVADLPNEKGVQEHTVNSSVDDHDTLTGSNTQGQLYSNTLGSTCNDWTSSVGNTGRPMAGHHWPGGPSRNWIQGHAMAGCAPGINLSNRSQGCASGVAGVGCEGGCGAFYCFALTP